MNKNRDTNISRRALIIGANAALTMPALLAPRRARAANAITIGFVTAETGPLAAFGESSDFVISQVNKALGGSIMVGGSRFALNILKRDSQSDPSRAADVAADLINSGNVDILIADSAPDTTNPVADQAEANQVPCITTVCPWQPYFFGRKGDPAKGFTWTYHFFWGLEDVEAAYIAMWDSVPNNHVVGGLFPNDADGNAWGDSGFGFPGVLPKHGYKVVDTGRFQPAISDFTAQISAFKAAGCDVVVGNLVPPDFATFWTQAGQQGFNPKIVTIGKALLFPSVVEAIGTRADGLSTEIWWTPRHPFKSGITGQNCAELCTAYTAATGRPWTQPLGYKHALFEVAIDVLKRAKTNQSQDVLAAITSTNYQSIVGPINWRNGPVKNVTKTPLVAGQWHKTDHGFDLTIDENATAAEIPVGGKLQLLGG
jgi:branched-chain amino acid transport system substrate-binding protein